MQYVLIMCSARRQAQPYRANACSKHKHSTAGVYITVMYITAIKCNSLHPAVICLYGHWAVMVIKRPVEAHVLRFHTSAQRVERKFESMRFDY